MVATGSCNIPAVDDVDVVDWVLAIDDCLESYRANEEETPWTKACIYRVPDFIRETKNRAFTPQVVSLGPFHNGAEALKPVEEHKQRALITFLKKSGKRLSDAMLAVHGIAPELQDCYHKLEKEWRDDVDKFTQLMVLDGCFVLETMRATKYNKEDLSKPMGVCETKYNKADSPSNLYATSDPVFGKHGVYHRVPYIQRDMLVLENQIPLKLLKVLLQLEGCLKVDINIDKYVNEMILEFFSIDIDPKNVDIDDLALHPLDMYRRSMIRGTGQKRSLETFKTIRSATRLNEAGISFKQSDGPFLNNVSYKHGALSLPFLIIDDVTEFRLLNMIAFEQIHIGCVSVVTAYVSFMDELIDTVKDVNLLENKGIIKNAHGSSDSVAKLFNEMGKEVTITPGWGLENVRKDVATRCESKWYGNIASLKHDYFHSPWALISLIGATLVILLTVLQTAYTIFQYHHPA